MSKLTISAHDDSFGASISGVDLSSQLSAEETQEIRKAWVKHRVVYFPDQPMNHDQLARFTLSFGGFGDDPYVKSIEEHQNILEVRRDPDEAVAPFGGGWHSDWSFQETPPSATILHSKVIPPLGGDTWYADGIAAYAALDPTTQSEIDDLHWGVYNGGNRGIEWWRNRQIPYSEGSGRTVYLDNAINFYTFFIGI